MRKLNFALFIALMIGVASCGSKNTLEGKWKLAEIGTITMPEGQEGMAEMAKGFMQSLVGNMTMEFKEDGTYSMKMSMMGQEKEEGGSYKTEEGKIITTNGEGEDERVEDADYKIEDGKLYFSKSDESGTFELIFEKAE